MITEIGITAGEIWHYLDGHGKSAMRDIVKGIGKPADVAMMSVGWLAREGHVVVEKVKNDYQVWLRQ